MSTYSAHYESSGEILFKNKAAGELWGLLPTGSMYKGEKKNKEKNRKEAIYENAFGRKIILYMDSVDTNPNK